MPPLAITFNQYTVPLCVLWLVFVVSVRLVGGRDGWRCLVSVVALPLLLIGAGWLMVAAHAPALPVVMIVGLAAVAIQVVLLLAPSPAARWALAGACGGYVVAAVLAVLAVWKLRLTGVYSPFLEDLWFTQSGPQLGFHWLALGAITLAGGGIIADLAVAVAATVTEVQQANPSLGRRELFAGGMRFGRDVISTEVNTLPLAILGASLGGLLLVMARPDVEWRPFSWMILTNRQATAVPIAALAAGTIGLAVTIPLTALLVSRALGAPSRSTRTRARRRGLALSVLLLVAAAVGGWLWLGRTGYDYPPRGAARAELRRGVVLSATPEASPWATQTQQAGRSTRQQLDVRLTDGRRVTVENPLTGSPAVDRVAVPGDRAIVCLDTLGAQSVGLLGDVERDRSLLVLLAACCVVVIAVGAWQGWRALAALAACLGLILVLLVAIVQWRLPPVPATLVAAALTAGLSYHLICGRGPKATGACIGALAGLACSGIVGTVCCAWMRLSGLCDTDLLALWQYTAARSLDFQQLLVAAALIAALGAVMDVAIGVASAVGEVKRADPAADYRRLLSSGMAVGRKVMAAMFGAVLFACLALNIALFLLPWAQGEAFWQAAGNERAITEVFRLLVAGLAIVWTIPATAAASAWLAAKTAPEGSAQ